MEESPKPTAQPVPDTVPEKKLEAMEEQEPSRARVAVGCFLQSCRLILDLFGLAFIVLCLALIVGFFKLERWAERDQRRKGATQSLRVEIRPGLSIRGIAYRLDKANVVRPASFLTAYALVHRHQGPLRAGEYAFAPGTPPKAVLSALTKGPEAQSIKVTVPEGYTIEQIAERLGKRKIVRNPARFLQLCKDAEFLKSIGITAPSVEGFLYPDTYFFLRDSDEKEVVQRMAARFDKEVQTLGLRPGLNNPFAYGLTFNEYVTLASILEREAADPEEIGLISSVYHNRLRKTMPLGSCATIRFALNKWRDPLTMEDLKINSPFNTYAKPGLPPQPICNPGHAALNAAFRPAKSLYFYYVYKGDRHHEFSETLREHEEAREKYKDLWLTWTKKIPNPEQ